MRRKLPDTVYVHWTDPDSEPWLETTEELDDHAEMHERRTVGEYQLVRIIDLEGTAIVRRQRKV
jgi:hypothetical protein